MPVPLIASLTLAENCGFCFGVRRAVDLVYELRRTTGKKIIVVGELIHNALFIERLARDGIVCVEESEIFALPDRREDVILVIRTHGIRREIAERLTAEGFEVVDATCPFVKRIHTIVDENSRDAAMTCIVGDEHHPEVVGIRSYAHSPSVVFADDKECEEFIAKNAHLRDNRVIMVSQTTGNYDKYVNCQKNAQKYYTNAKIFDTICNVTENRQREAAKLASQSDAMLVIGCAKSSNTKKLRDIAAKVCEHVFLVENASEIPAEALADAAHKLGRPLILSLTAGASTPDDIIQEVKVRAAELLL